MRYDPARTALTCQVVYHGAPGSGVSSAVWRLRATRPADQLQEQPALVAGQDPRLLFPTPEFGLLLNCQLWLDVVAIPSEVHARHYALHEADGVVLVLDSQPEAHAANANAIAELQDVLTARGDAAPVVVVQATKQDIPGRLAPDALLRSHLPNSRWPVLGSSTATDTGFSDIFFMLLGHLRERAMRLGLPAAAPPWVCWHCQQPFTLPTGTVGKVLPCPHCAQAVELQGTDTGRTASPRIDIPSARIVRSTTRTTRPLGPDDRFDIVEELDTSLIGRRQRLRERTTGILYRGLTLAPALLGRPGLVEGLDHRLSISKAGLALHLPVHAVQPAGAGWMVLSADAPNHPSLAQLLTQHRAIEVRRAVRIVQQLAMAADAAAAHGLIHGWLRPEAILVDAHGHVLVDDIVVPPVTAALFDTVAPDDDAEHWIAPEALDGQPPTLRTIGFLLAAVLLRLVTGHRQVRGRVPRLALQQLLSQGPLRLGQPGLGAPPAVVDLHQRLLATGLASHGFTSTSELVAACTECLSTLAGTGSFRRHVAQRTTTTITRRPTSSPRPPSSPPAIRRITSATPHPAAPVARTATAPFLRPVAPPPPRIPLSTWLAAVALFALIVTVGSALVLRHRAQAAQETQP